MDAWRLASRRHDPLSGEGARLVGGRWSSPGHAVIYASESLALALVEALVHLPGPLPKDYMACRIAVPEEHVEHLDLVRLKAGWASDLGYTRAIGDQWLEQSRSLALAVPSVVVPSSLNFLLNPSHARAELLEVRIREPMRFDPRFR